MMVEDYTIRVRTNSDIMMGECRGRGSYQASWREKIQARRL